MASQKSISEIHDYVKNDMKMQHMYQPMIIKVLLESGGRASKSDIAQKMNQRFKQKTAQQYEQKIFSENEKEPKKVLMKYGIVTTVDDSFSLNLNFNESPEDEIKNLIKLCEQKIKEYGNGPKPSEKNMENPVKQLIERISQSGFFFQPWQIANFITAIKTKPFLILAGISGTGKSKLPSLIGQFTGAKVHMIPVRPDWTDSTELIGYQNLQDEFVNGHLLNICDQAQKNPDTFHICILDEMNLARVEQYFAEVLSLIEDRVREGDIFRSRHPLSHYRPDIFLPHNLMIVGTVNMDETTHGFSRKVLDRAFTLEMSDIQLDQWKKPAGQEVTVEWSPDFWTPLALKLSDLEPVNPDQEKLINNTIEVLKEVNTCLKPAQLQVGYRVRDEVCLYLLHAQALQDHFVTESDDTVKTLDLALHMKILPRIQGSSLAINDVLQRLLSWCLKPQNQDIEEVVNKWKKEQPQIWKESRYPHTAGRLLTMYERYQQEGFTSYWL